MRAGEDVIFERTRRGLHTHLLVRELRDDETMLRAVFIVVHKGVGERERDEENQEEDVHRCAHQTQTLRSTPTVSTTSTEAPVGDSTHMGVSYVFKRSLPLSRALTNAGPRAGTRYTVKRKAKMEKPTEASSAGTGGSGSSSGRMRSHAPMGASERSITDGSGRGASA